MRNYLPSKKVVFAMLVVLVLLVFVFKFSSKEKEGGILLTDNEDNLDRENLSLVAERDRDEDGLADWEESLWGTNPNNPDSDGDGTLDGDEVIAGRDPALAGPNDTFREKSLGSNQIIAPGEELSLTEKFGRELFVGYTSLKARNNFRGSQTEILYNLLSQNASAVELSEEYGLLNINTVNQNSAEFLKSYGNSLAINFREGLGLNEIEVIVSMLESESVEDKKRLDDLISTNKNILKKNLNVLAPHEARFLHLAIINSHNKIIKSLENIGLLHEDPLIAIVGIGQYSAATDEFQKIIESLKEYFSIKKVDFSGADPGYIFSKQ